MFSDGDLQAARSERSIFVSSGKAEAEGFVHASEGKKNGAVNGLKAPRNDGMDPVVPTTFTNKRERRQA